MGTVEHAEEGTKVRAKSVELLSEVRARMSREAVVSVDANRLQMSRWPRCGDSAINIRGCPLRFVVEMPEEIRVEMIVKNAAVDPASNIRAAVGQLFSKADALGIDEHSVGIL